MILIACKMHGPLSASKEGQPSVSIRLHSPSSSSFSSSASRRPYTPILTHRLPSKYPMQTDRVVSEESDAVFGYGCLKTSRNESP